MSEYILSLAADSPIEHYAIDTEAEEIVRCRDCKHYEDMEVHFFDNLRRTVPTCARFDGFYHLSRPDGFCAWGERKDGGE